MNELLLMTITVFIFSVGMCYATSSYYFLITNLIMPSAFISLYNSVYKPMIRKVQKDIELQEKYQHLYSKFIDGGKE